MARGFRSAWVYVGALVMLGACLWVGWSDFDPYVPQEVVRGAIREAPRQVVQAVVQFVAPAVIVAFLASEAVARWRAHARRARD